MHVPKTKLFGRRSQACDARGTRESISTPRTYVLQITEIDIDQFEGGTSVSVHPVTGAVSRLVGSSGAHLARGEETKETLETREKALIKISTTPTRSCRRVAGLAERRRDGRRARVTLSN